MILVVLGVLWLPALAFPCVAEGLGCIRVPTHHADRGALPAHGCCVVSSGPCVAEAPPIVDVAPMASQGACVTPEDAATAPSVRSECSRVPAHGPPTYLRLRVLLV